VDGETRELFTRLTDVVLVQATSNERIADTLDRVDARLALPAPRPALSGGSVALLMLVVALAAAAGSFLGVSALQDAQRPLAVAAQGR
jgi:hypothetical protein